MFKILGVVSVIFSLVFAIAGAREVAPSADFDAACTLCIVFFLAGFTFFAIAEHFDR